MTVKKNSPLCPRCGGRVWQDASEHDDDKCIVCGWRQVELSPDAISQIKIYTGKQRIEGNHQRYRTLATV
ncbi:MAG: hypothetical protein MK384_06640 [SAR202 cluster bacterium]|nr:hypothetical protein [SAR202 cluster bacterium]